MINKKSSNEMRKVRHSRIRKNISGTAIRPRLCVFRSNKNIYAQIIDDEKQVTIISASTLDSEITVENGGNVAAATAVGKLIAERALAKNITTVVFDRGGYLYHGKIKALAEAARAAGLQF